MSELMDAAVYYAKMGLAIFPIRPKSKKPMTRNGVKDAQRYIPDIKEMWSKFPDANIAIAGGAASGDLLIIDLDVDPDSGKDGTETLSEWEREHGELPETVVSITGRGGYHYFYRVPHGSEFTNSVNEELGVDIRFNNAYVIAPPSIHPNGARYEWEHSPEDYTIADADVNTLAFIKHVQKGCTPVPGERFTLPEKISKGSRDETLFRYACSLQSQGMTDAEITTLVHLANEKRCQPPMALTEVDKKISQALAYAKGERKDEVEEEPEEDGPPSFRSRRAKFLHNVMGDYLISNRHACKIDGAPAIWTGERYESGYHGIHRAIVELCPDATRTNCSEVYSYLDAKMPDVDPAPANLIAFTNGVYDLNTDSLMEYGPETVITNVIPWEYNPDADCPIVDTFLDDISCGDIAVRNNLVELLGLCMHRSSAYGISAMLLGKGSNGKSTYLDTIQNVLGRENVSNLDLAQIGQHFQGVHVVGKLANIGDDISNKRIDGDTLAIFKKMVTGSPVYTDVKGGMGFMFVPYATLIYSANEMPTLEDHSEGVLRRLFPIPFNAKFKPDIDGFDPNIADKLKTREAAEYLIQLALDGLMRLTRTNHMTSNAKSEEILTDIELTNDSVLQWLDETGHGAKYFIGRETKSAYSEYENWAHEANVMPFSRRRFSARICGRFDLTSVSSNGLRTYRKKENN